MSGDCNVCRLYTNVDVFLAVSNTGSGRSGSNMIHPTLIRRRSYVSRIYLPLSGLREEEKSIGADQWIGGAGVMSGPVSIFGIAYK